MPLQLPRANAKRVDGRATQDLTAHPWAGLKVRMTLDRPRPGRADRARASLMNSCCPSGLSPSRWPGPWSSSARSWCAIPSAPDGVANALDALTLGGDKVIDDSTVYLALRNAYWRLRGDRSREGIASVVDQLWSTALRIEEGDLPEAERAVERRAGRADAGA